MLGPGVHHHLVWPLVLPLMFACGTPSLRVAGERWTDADLAFHGEPRWLGGDGAYSIELDDDRVLWLFGDSFIATSDALSRGEAEMVRNSIAVQRGRDPRTATMRFQWGVDPDGSPASFFAERADTWHWPGHGARLDDGSVVVFLSVLRASDAGLGFTAAGYRVAILGETNGTWQVDTIDAPTIPFDAVPGAAVVRDAGYLVTVAPRFDGDHDAYLARFREMDLSRGVAEPEWWEGERWIEQSALRGAPAIVIPGAGTECSLHHDGALGWVHVATRGFGAATIVVRTAPAITGPYSDPVEVDVLPPPADDSDIVYAGKAHPELDADGALAVTYATNTLDFGRLVRTRELYWPRFVRLRLTRP